MLFRSPAHVDEVLAFRFVAGADTLFKGVRHVLPGHRLTIRTSGVSSSCYWTVPDKREHTIRSRADAVEQLDEVLTRRVRAQLASDVPVGCQLSGGIDSTLVAMRAGASIPAWSILVSDPLFSEEPWGRAAAEIGRAHV